MVGDDTTGDVGRGALQNKKTDKESTKRRILCILTAAILLAALAATGWFYYDSAKEIRKQKALIGNLRERLRDLGVVDLDGGGEAVACSGGSNYSADIGNFEIAVSSPNVIIRSLDANFEGGPITNLTIGRCLAGETNVVDNYLTNQVTILAHPAADAATLRANFEAEWGSSLTAGASVTIDGVTGQIYTGEGLFTAKLVYFDHNGIGYQIELPETNPTSEAILTDVISDWSFTP